MRVTINPSSIIIQWEYNEFTLTVKIQGKHYDLLDKSSPTSSHMQMKVISFEVF